MKLLYITQMYPSEELPQYCIFLHLQVKALIAEGVDITVVIPDENRPSSTAVYDGVDIVYLNYKNYSRSILYGLIGSRLTRELKRFLNAADYDVVYAIHAPANILDFARVLSEKARRPLAVHYRGYNIFREYHPEPKVFLSNNEKIRERVVKASALSIGVSKKVVNIITDRFPDAPVEVVYNGVDAEEFSPADSAESPDELRILCAANLIPIKGHKYLFDAVKTITQRNEGLKLRTDIVGRGPLENELKGYVEKNRIPGVSFHGYLPHDEVAQMMQSTDILALPSVYESFGNVCLEAMSCKKPVVIFKGQGIDELLTDGVSGMIAEKGNAADYTEKLEKLILDKALRKTIAENGNRIAEEFTWERSAKSIIRALEKVTAHG